MHFALDFTKHCIRLSLELWLDQSTRSILFSRSYSFDNCNWDHCLAEAIKRVVNFPKDFKTLTYLYLPKNISPTPLQLGFNCFLREFYLKFVSFRPTYVSFCIVAKKVNLRLGAPKDISKFFRTFKFYNTWQSLSSFTNKQV